VDWFGINIFEDLCCQCGDILMSILAMFDTLIIEQAHETQSNRKIPPMKPKYPYALLLASSLLAAQANAQLTWDPSGGGASDGSSAWLGTGEWWNGAANVDWTSGSDAIFGNGGAAGNATLASPTAAGTITFNSFTGTYNLGTTGQALTINNGVTMNAGSGAVTFTSPIILSGDQTWTNNSGGLLKTNNGTNLITNGGFDLTIGGTGDTTFGVVSNSAVALTGSGNLVKNGSGRLNIGGVNSGFTGTVAINGGVLQMINNAGGLGDGNVSLNGGVLSFYWSTTYSRTLGTGNGQVQILGGESGFAGAGTNGPSINLGSTVVWGALGDGPATGFFNPGKFVLGDAGTTNAATTSFSSNIDLNGANRTIVVPKGLSSGGNNSTITGMLSNSSGTAAGFIKEGGGNLLLMGNNTYTGDTKVLGGTLRFGNSWNNSWTGVTLDNASNLEINNAIVQANYYLTRDLGTGSGEIQITGGRTGFSNMQSDAVGNAFVKFTDNATTVTWGSASFDPSTLVLNDSGALGVLRMQNPFDLNGANRTIEVSATGPGGGRGTYGTMEGALSGTGASLTKTGVGTLMLQGANTYNGGTNINGGGLWFDTTASMPATGAVAVNDGTFLNVTVGGSGWTAGTSGNGTMGGLLAGLGGQTGSTVSYTGDVSVGLNISGTQTYAGDIADVGTSLSLHIGNKDGTTSGDPFIRNGTLTLSGNNSYTGGTFLNKGTLEIGSATAIGSSALTFNGGTLSSSDSSARTISNTLVLAGNVGAGGTGDIVFSDTSNTQVSDTNNSTRTFIVDSGISATFNQLFTANGNSGITKTGLGDMLLNGTNSYTGSTTVQQGNLIAGTDVSSANNVNGAFGRANSNINVGLSNNNNDAGVLAGGAFTIGRNFQVLSQNTTDTGTRIVSFGGNSADASTFSGNIILGSNNSSSKGTSLTAAAGGQATFSGVISNPTGQDSTEAANAAAGIAVTKIGAGTVVLSNTNTYTGATVVSEGSLIINGAVASTSVVVAASLGGSGVMANATLSGSGSINPGSSPGVLTASATDPTGGLAYNFEFTAANTLPTWNNATASVNDVLRLTNATPFTASLDSSNTIALYLGVGSINNSDVFTGGFYTDENSDFLSSISSATFQYFLADAGGSETYNGNNYTEYTGPLGFTVATFSQTADFGSGNVTGYTSQFTVVPEPSAVLLGALGFLALLRRRR